MTNSAHFTPALFEFLSELAENNNREWFQDNKARYERDVRDALVRFVADFGDRLHEISPHMVADPRLSGGSIFRIYRDVRFSKDKSPYKTNAGMHFRHEVGREVHGAGTLPASPAGNGVRRGGYLASELGHSGQDQGLDSGEPGEVEKHRQRRWVHVGLYAGGGVAEASATGNRRGPPADRPPEAQVFRGDHALYGGRRLRAGLHRSVLQCLRHCFALLGVSDESGGAGLVAYR